MFYGFIFTLLKVITSSFSDFWAAQTSLPTLKISKFCFGKNILIVSAGFLSASADRLIVSAEAIRKEEGKSPLHLPHKGGVLGCHLSQNSLMTYWISDFSALVLRQV